MTAIKIGLAGGFATQIDNTHDARRLCRSLSGSVDAVTYAFVPISARSTSHWAARPLGAGQRAPRTVTANQRHAETAT